MITGLLLLPVLAILTWLYWFLLPGRAWKLADTLIASGIVVLEVAVILWVASLEFPGAGPIWPQVVSVVSAYAILIFGLGLALWCRRSRGCFGKLSNSRKNTP